MSVAYKAGQTLGPDDLKISITDTNGALVDPSAITYSLFDFTTGIEVLIGTPNVVPASTGVGQFYVQTTLPLDANVGDWVVRWNFKELPTSAIVQVVQEFNIIGEQTFTTYGTGIAGATDTVLMRRLRIMLRDNNPDRNYRFRPPSTEQFIQTQTEVFGYIWEDEELFEYLLMSIDYYNSAPPVTGITIDSMPDRWRTVILMGAAAQACRSVALNWIADEFNYSVSGVSLDLEKSSKYMAMKENYEAEFDKAVEQAKQSIKIVKGLKQPRYGVGISSALGPYNRVGTQSRSNYVGGGGGYWT
jgi:hypothetical protein